MRLWHAHTMLSIFFFLLPRKRAFADPPQPPRPKGTPLTPILRLPFARFDIKQPHTHPLLQCSWPDRPRTLSLRRPPSPTLNPTSLYEGHAKARGQVRTGHRPLAFPALRPLFSCLRSLFSRPRPLLPRCPSRCPSPSAPAPSGANWSRPGWDSGRLAALTKPGPCDV